MQEMVIVNASNLLSDDQVRAIIPALQVQYDRDFKPAWGKQVPDIHYSFAPMSEIPKLSKDAWPLFLNKHSQDPGALGWHTREQRKVFGRVYVGDCLRFGIHWQTDLGHEALEMALDPEATRTWRMPDGRLAALEACDAVEADDLEYLVSTPQGLQVPCTDFVLPAYFSSDQQPGTRYDHGGHLRGPCPALTPGGYMSIKSAEDADFQTVSLDRSDGLPGRRFLITRHRRALRRAS